jgi:hypothetical protein
MSLSLAEFSTRVAADLAERGIDVLVEFGDWKEAHFNSAGRVVIGVASEFEDSDYGPANTPGLASLTPGSNDDLQTMASTIFTMVEQATVWVHAKPPADEKSATYFEDSHNATMVLVKATLAAMWRQAQGMFSWAQGRVLNPSSSELRYGVVATFRAQLLTPVLNDPVQARRATGYSGEVYAEMPNDGPVLVGTIEKDVP